MQNNSKKAFTIVEILICLAIVSGIIGTIISMMSRGASNVQKGSFSALAANQACWIVSVIRNDIARSDESRINMETNGDEGWTGDTDFYVTFEGGRANYFVEKKGDIKTFVRKFEASSGSSAFPSSEDKIQRFGDEYLTDMVITLEDDGSYLVKIYMDEPKKYKAGGEHQFVWTASIFPPTPSGMGKYWAPTMNSD